MSLTWTAWNNGKHHTTGAGYGLKVSIADRDRHFKREWKSVILEIPVSGSFKEVLVNIDKSSFWNETCREVINQAIGRWFRNSGFAPWPSGKPPKLKIEVIGERRFRVSSIISLLSSSGTLCQEVSFTRFVSHKLNEGD